MVTCLIGFMGILGFMGTITLSNRPWYSSFFTHSPLPHRVALPRETGEKRSGGGVKTIEGRGGSLLLTLHHVVTHTFQLHRHTHEIELVQACHIGIERLLGGCLYALMAQVAVYVCGATAHQLLK